MTRFNIKQSIIQKGYNSSTSPQREKKYQPIMLPSSSARNFGQHRVLVNNKISPLRSLYKVDGETSRQK